MSQIPAEATPDQMRAVITSDSSLTEMLRARALRHPDAPALTCEGRTVTYRELDVRASRVAHGLALLGVRPGERVAYLGRNRLEFFELLFGAVKAGMVLAPVNWRLTSGEIGDVLADAQAKLVFADQEFAQVPTGMKTIELGEEYASWRDSCPHGDPGRTDAPGEVVVQFYTSGTTGLPKGVQITNTGLGMLSQAGPGWRLDEDSVVLVAMPLFHMGGSAWGLVALRWGGHLVVVPDFDPPEVLDLMGRHRVTNVLLAPAMMQFLADVPDAAERDHSALRAIVYGAAPITSQAVRLTVDTFGCQLIQIYGLTETTGGIVQLEAEDHRQELLRSAGRPYPWVELQITDPASGEGLPPRDVGEVRVRTTQNSIGYWNNSADTATLLPGDGWLRTGDAGYLDEEGYLFLTDRIKDMIISGGENIYPIEVENVLAAHPDVADVAVIGVPDDTWGESVKAVVVQRRGAELTEEALLEWARERLAGFKRPRSADFAAELPRNPSGKILKKDLRKPYWTGHGRNVS